jgi:hypothetical protein
METVRAYRWRISLPTLYGSDDTCLYASSVSRPSPEVDTVTIHCRGNEIKLPGKYRWGTINIKFYEKVHNLNPSLSTAGILRKWWAGHIHEIATHRIVSLEKVNKQRVHIHLLDGAGNIIYQYELTMAFPIKIDSSELDYSSTDISTTIVTLAYSGVKEGKP